MPTFSPLTYAAAGLALLLLIGCGVQTWRLHTRDAELAAAVADNARLQAQAHELEAANQEWAAKSATQSAAVETLAKVANDAQAAGQKREVKVKPVTVKSDLIAEAIIAAAKRNKVDLIVMASHGRKGIKRLLLGSETQQVLTHSHIPVLVLR